MADGSNQFESALSGADGETRDGYLSDSALHGHLQRISPNGFVPAMGSRWRTQSVDNYIRGNAHPQPVDPAWAEDELVKNGIPRTAAKGVVAGIFSESALNPNASNNTAGGQGAQFLGQWRGPRLDALTSQYGPDPTPQQQIAFLANEIKNGDASGAGPARSVLTARTPMGAAQAFVTDVMRPGKVGAAQDMGRVSSFLRSGAGGSGNPFEAALSPNAPAPNPFESALTASPGQPTPQTSDAVNGFLRHFRYNDASPNVFDRAVNFVGGMFGAKPGEIQQAFTGGVESGVGTLSRGFGRAMGAFTQEIAENPDYAAGLAAYAGGPGTAGAPIEPLLKPGVLPKAATPQEAAAQGATARGPLERAGLSMQREAQGQAQPTSLAGNIAGFAGGAVPYLVSGGAAPVAMGVSGYEDVKEKAEQTGIPDQQSDDAAAENALLQAGLGLLPVGKVLERLAPEMRTAAARYLTGVGAHIVGNGSVGAAMQIGANAIVKQTVNPNQDLWDGVGQNAGLMAAFGAMHRGAEPIFRGEAGNLASVATGKVESPETHMWANALQAGADEAKAAAGAGTPAQVPEAGATGAPERRQPASEAAPEAVEAVAQPVSEPVGPVVPAPAGMPSTDVPFTQRTPPATPLIDQAMSDVQAANAGVMQPERMAGHVAEMQASGVMPEDGPEIQAEKLANARAAREIVRQAAPVSGEPAPTAEEMAASQGASGADNDVIRQSTADVQSLKAAQAENPEGVPPHPVHDQTAAELSEAGIDPTTLPRIPTDQAAAEVASVRQERENDARVAADTELQTRMGEEGVSQEPGENTAETVERLQDAERQSQGVGNEELDDQHERDIDNELSGADHDRLASGEAEDQSGSAGGVETVGDRARPDVAAPQTPSGVGEGAGGGGSFQESASGAPPRAGGYGANNTVIGKDAYEAAKARALARMRNRESFGGSGGALDPEQVQDLTLMGAYHLEAGARSFGAWAQEMLRDLGEWTRPFLRPIYEMTRMSYPDMTEGTTEAGAISDGMVASVADYSHAARDRFKSDLNTYGKAWRPDGTLATLSENPTDRPNEAERLAADAFRTHDGPERIASHLLAGGAFSTITEARRFMAGEGPIPKSGTPEAKRMDEEIEEGIVQAARQIAARGGDAGDTYDEMVDLYRRQPSLNQRSSGSVERQAYSTPAPLAWIASKLAGITHETTVYEPTAGNGMLLIDTGPAKVRANEIDPERAAALRRQGFAHVTEYDAADRTENDTSDVVIANPPFGAVRDATGERRLFELGDRYRTGEIDHAIAVKALEAMKDDGRAVLIIGSVNKLATGEKRAEAYNGKAKREFFYRIYNAYNVTDHFTVDGSLYAKQGAAWPVDVIVIDGRGKSSLTLPAADLPRTYDSWTALKGALDGREAGAARVRGPEDVVTPHVATGGTTHDLDAAAGGRSGTGWTPGERKPAVERTPQPEPVRDQSAGREPGSAGPSVSTPPDHGELEAPDLERNRVVPELEEAEGTEQAPTQVPYQPVSKESGLDTLAPVNMASATRDALEALAKRRGDVDQYVSDNLGMDREDLGKHFSAEQVDALALALDNMDRGAGFILGDQTGVGKGRVVAGVIRYAIRNGILPIFVTEKPNLYGDMYRDMKDVGIPQMLGRRPEILPTNAALSGSNAIPLDDGVSLSSSPSKVHNAHLSDVALGKAKKPDVVFTTYNQMQAVEGDETVRREALRRLAKGSILIFDESHNAGGQGEEEGKRKAKVGTAPDRSEFAREIAETAKGVLFSSATYAKRPGVMDLYKSTDMRHAVKDIKELPGLIRKGGVPLQQAVAQMLAAAGQYIRRERSFAGVDYRTTSVPVDHEAYARITETLSRILNFERDHVDPAVKLLHSAARAEAKMVTGSTAGSGVDSTNFTAIMHNLVDQMLLGLKADDAADMAIQALKEGRKPVLTVANTLETILHHYAEQHGLSTGAPVKGDFRDILQRYLDRTRDVRIKKPNEESERYHLTDEDIGPEAVRAYDEAKAFIHDLDVANIPFSPIDYIRNRIEQAGFKTGEITGRSRYVDYSGEHPVMRTREGAEKSAGGRSKTIKSFNDGDLDALVLNQAGSTGLSLHSGRNFKDQRRRHMIIVQPEKNIDTHMQMLGRVHRTGQVVPPEYDQMNADIPAETRPAAVLAKKMASLNANTTGARGSALTGNAPDFMNHIGDQIAAEMVARDPELAEKLGDPIPVNDDGTYNAEDAARKVTGRLVLLAPEEQEAFYEQMLAHYRMALAEAEANGTSPLEAKTLPLDAKPLSSRVIVPPNGKTHSPFGGAVTLETMDVKRLGRPPPFSDAIARLAHHVDADQPPIADAASLPALAAKGREVSNKLIDRARREFDQWQWTAKRGQKFADAQEAAAHFNQLTDTLRPGAMVTTNLGGEDTHGVVVSLKRDGKSDNPLAPSDWRAMIVVADPRKMIELPLSRVTTDPSDENKVAVRPFVGSPEDMQRAFEDTGRVSRETRTFATGNILSAFSHLKGIAKPIVNFVTHEGDVRAGIMLPRGYDFDKAADKEPAQLPTPEHALEWLRRGEKVSGDNLEIQASKPTGKRMVIATPAAKSAGGKIYLDKALRQTIGEDFYKKGDRMVATVDLDRGDAKPLEVLRLLSGLSNGLEARANSRAARDMVNGKEEPEGDVAAMRRRTGTLAAPEGATVRVARGVRGEPLEAGDVGAHAAVERVRALLQRLAPGVRLDPYRRIFDTREGADGSETLGMIGGKAEDGQLRHIVALAMEGPDAIGQTRHEAIHALRRSGVIPDADWEKLRGMARSSWLARFKIAEKYPDLKTDPDKMEEEAVAEAFRTWRRGDMVTPKGPIGRIFERIRGLLQRVSADVRQALGNDADWEKVFRRIDSGEMGEPLRVQKGNPGAEKLAAFRRMKALRSQAAHLWEGHAEDIYKQAGGQGTPEDAHRWARNIGTPDEWSSTVRPSLDQRERMLGYNSAIDEAAVAHDKAQAAWRDYVDRFSDTASMRRQGEPDRNSDSDRWARQWFTKVVGAAPDAVGRLARASLDRFMPAEATEWVNQAMQIFTPLSQGAKDAQVKAKEYANAIREIGWRAGRLDKWLTKEFKPDRRREMWEAWDEQGRILKDGREPGPGEGVNRLTEREQAVMWELKRRFDDTWRRAAQRGMVDPESKMDFWSHRMIMRQRPEGDWAYVGSSGENRTNAADFHTLTGAMRHRRYETPEETEAAARAKFGRGTVLVRDVRTSVKANQSLEEAIAAHDLIAAIEQQGKMASVEMVTSDATKGLGRGFFTLDHPAFVRWRPEFVTDADGKVVPRRDTDGKIVFKAQKIFVAKGFEGPLSAIMDTRLDKLEPLYRAYMKLKETAMGFIMFSPFMHNLVIWGKSLSVDPLGVGFGLAYFHGHAVRQEENTMALAYRNGYVDVSHERSPSRVSIAADTSNIVPGGGWGSQLIGAMAAFRDRAVQDTSRTWEQNAKRAVDAGADFWHNTMLWDRVADLQAHIFKTYLDKYVKHGFDEDVAAKIAAHVSNRYAGALPREALGKWSRALADVAFFSRSFNLTNMGVYKDLLTGLPSEVQAAIRMAHGEAKLSRAQASMRFTAAKALALDLMIAKGLVYLGQAAVASAFGIPFQKPTQNEHSPQNDKRSYVFAGYDSDGTGIYVRLPTGKTAEDLQSWISKPKDTAARKLSPFARFAIQFASNDTGYGRRMYDPYADTNKERLQNIAKIMGAFTGSFLPDNELAAIGAATKPTAEPIDEARAFLPLLGLTVSHGARGGPAVGVYEQEQARIRAQFQDQEADIKQQIRHGDLIGAKERMNKIGVAPSYQSFIIRTTLHPGLRLSAAAIRRFYLGATPQEREAFEDARGRDDDDQGAETENAGAQ